MLFPVVLFGAVWADLNRPTTEAEVARSAEAWNRRVQAEVRGQQPPSPDWATRAWTAYQHTRGRILVARVKVGMTKDDVQKIFGAADGQTGYFRGPEGQTCLQLYDPIGVCIEFRLKPPRPDGRGKRDEPFTVYRVQADTLPEIAALFLPHRPRPR
jgi:hypothetical protein